ncbi:hypothetical protein EYF80_008849 [Liparis tanakae]|uniref:Uncharacterized protein n=1 Tax=Liparis tanakae TaxID=230148 RepID=A0A4Z2ITI6_9TELE|nr:hypothetical protein EYF80_008849 [Liparis tanakae]
MKEQDFTTIREVRVRAADLRLHPTFASEEGSSSCSSTLYSQGGRMNCESLAAGHFVLAV